MNATSCGGKITTRSWDDQNGNKKYMTEIVADNFIMLDKKQDTIPGDSPIGVKRMKIDTAPIGIKYRAG